MNKDESAAKTDTIWKRHSHSTSPQMQNSTGLNPLAGTEEVQNLDWKTDNEKRKVQEKKLTVFSCLSDREIPRFASAWKTLSPMADLERRNAHPLWSENFIKKVILGNFNSPPFWTEWWRKVAANTAPLQKNSSSAYDPGCVGWPNDLRQLEEF